MNGKLCVSHEQLPKLLTEKWAKWKKNKKAEGMQIAKRVKNAKEQNKVKILVLTEYESQ